MFHLIKAFPQLEKGQNMRLDYNDDDQREAELAQARRDGATAGYQSGYTAGKAAGELIGRAQGAAAERERIKTIMSMDIARERPREAAHIALSTSAEPKDAVQAIRGMVVGAQAAADASWREVQDKLNRESGFGGRR
jgi:flagellar biosynthesis/type III secretory pathway protein FliH